MNSVSLIGRATDKPTLKYVGQTNRPVAEFSLAVDDPFNKDPKTNQPRAYFFRIVIWGAKGEAAATHITKGQQIGITGRLTQEEYSKQGEDKPRQSTRIVAESFDLLARPQGSSANASRPTTEAPPAAATEEPEGDIPF